LDEIRSAKTDLLTTLGKITKESLETYTPDLGKRLAARNVIRDKIAASMNSNVFKSDILSLPVKSVPLEARSQDGLVATATDTLANQGSLLEHDRQVWLEGSTAHLYLRKINGYAQGSSLRARQSFMTQADARSQRMASSLHEQATLLQHLVDSSIKLDEERGERLQFCSEIDRMTFDANGSGAP
jgi:hypothetical protein